MRVVVSSKSGIDMHTYTCSSITYTEGNYVLATTEGTKTFSSGSYIIMILN